MDRFTPEDLLRFALPAGAAVRPGGAAVCYTVTRLDAAEDLNCSHLWCCDLGPDGRAVRNRQLTHGPHRDRDPVWSPDGRYLAFVSDRSGRPQLWVLPLDGGEPWLLAPVDGSVSDPVWSPDGKAIAFTVRVEQAPDPDLPAPAGAGSARVRVTTRLHYKLDGVGLLGDERSHIFVAAFDGLVPGAAVRARQVTGGAFDHRHPAWAPDGRRLAFAARRSADADRAFGGEIWVAEGIGLRVEDGAGVELRRVAHLEGDAHAPAWSPDGSAIAFYGHDNHALGATNLGIWRVPADGGAAPQCLTAGFDRSFTNHVRSYERATPPPERPVWRPGGDAVLGLATDGGATRLYAADAAGRGVRLVGPEEDAVLTAFGTDASGETVVVCAETELGVGDLWLLRRPTGSRGYPGGPAARLERLTDVNGALFSSFRLSRPTPLSFAGAGGWPIEGWLLLPPDHAPGARHPLVLNIHGGPHGTWGHTFMAENHALAAAGFAVAFVNPRGSQGYGEAFTRAVDNDWGGGDRLDQLAAVDAAVATGAVDPERIGVMGNSYGGFMTNWLLATTDRFRAGVTQGTISNRHSFWGTSDFGYFRAVRPDPVVPWRDVEAMWRISPLARVEAITAPLLILHGEEDHRCPMEQAEQLYTALRWLGRTACLVRYPGAGHGFTRTGRPSHRVDRLRRIVHWFETHLKPAPGPAPAS